MRARRIRGLPPCVLTKLSPENKNYINYKNKITVGIYQLTNIGEDKVTRRKKGTNMSSSKKESEVGEKLESGSVFLMD